MRCLFFIFLLSYFLTQPLIAQENRPANPNISALIDGVDDEESKSDDLRLQNLSMRFDIYGQAGQGEINATLYNSSDKELEGKFEFALPTGAVVTGYAIDLENGKRGQLIDGVLLEKEKAKRTYENQVRGQIDPGLANVSREGVFTTQIYPINPEDTRTLRVKFSFALDGINGLQLPVLTDHEIENWDIEVSVDGVLQKPDMAIFNAVDVLRKSGKYNLTASGANEKLDGMLRIAPVNAAPILISKHDNGEEFVQLSGKLPAARGVKKEADLIAIYWDNSRSRRNDNLDMEISLARSIMAGLNPKSTILQIYNSEKSSTASPLDADDLEKKLRAVNYIGGSNHNSVADELFPNAEICLMFTDGIETIDIGAEIDLNCSLHIISTSASANSAILSAIARKNGGAFHAVSSERDITKTIAAILNDAPIVQNVRGEGGRLRPFITLPTQAGKYSIIVKSQSDKEVRLKLGSARSNVRRNIILDVNTEDHNGAASLWASDQLERRENDIDRKAFLEFARSYSVEASSLSFLVLEEPEDYVDADIAPPKSYPAELMEKFVEERKEADEEEAADRGKRFSQLLDDWEELKEWWEEDYDIPTNKNQVNSDVPPPPAPPVAAPPPSAQGSEGVSEVAEVAADAAEPAADSVFGFLGDAPIEAEDEEEFVIVTGSRIASPTIGIEIDAWQADRPYLKALEGKEDDFWTVYWEQEKPHGTLPVFYLDIAHWLHEKGRTQEAVEVLLSALELESSDDETKLIVATRLQRYGQVARAIILLELIAASDPERPQPRRNLALALLKRAKLSQNGKQSKEDYERGLNLLNDIAINPLPNGDEGIDLIALVEANAALPRALKAGAKNPLDKRLVALLDADIRIVIEWTTENTDIDLWVIEPTTEKAFYGNQLTQIGGHVSNDMTDGYGPEEYLLRRAIAGEYEVRANLYSNDRINPNGTSILTARLIRNFGRPNESEESIDFELTGDVNDDKKIGTLTVSE